MLTREEKTMKSIYKLMFLSLFSIVYAQSFITPFSSGLPGSEDVVIELKSGEEVTGKISMGMVVFGRLLSITIKDTDGNKRKFKTKEGLMKRIKVKLGKYAKAMLKMDAASKSLVGALTADYAEMDKREWAIYELALRPKKKDKYDMMQLLNPGFDSVIKIYNDPKAKETKGLGGLTGGEKKSYLAVVNGGKSMKIEKGKYKYKKQFTELYNGCESLMSKYKSKNIKVKWGDFAKHVAQYDKDCSK